MTYCKGYKGHPTVHLPWRNIYLQSRSVLLCGKCHLSQNMFEIFLVPVPETWCFSLVWVQNSVLAYLRNLRTKSADFSKLRPEYWIWAFEQVCFTRQLSENKRPVRVALKPSYMAWCRLHLFSDLVASFSLLSAWWFPRWILSHWINLFCVFCFPEGCIHHNAGSLGSPSHEILHTAIEWAKKYSTLYWKLYWKCWITYTYIQEMCVLQV